MPTRLPRAALIAYCLATLTHLGALQWDWTAVEWASKPLLTLSLLTHVALSPGPSCRATAAFGLVWALAGDIVLQFEGTAAFAIGILCFAVMQVSYQRGFIASGALATLRRVPTIPLVYAAVVIALSAWLAPLVGGPLAALVVGYGLLLATTAALSAGAGWAAGAGGALFLVSDTAIAAKAFAGVLPPTPWFVMATYACAQVLLVRSLLRSGAIRHTTTP